MKKLANRLIYYYFNGRTVFRKPRYLKRLFFTAASYYLTSNNRLRSLGFANTYICNFNCTHCYAKRFADNPNPPLSKKEKIDVIKQALDIGVISFEFVGGESILDPDLVDLIDACDPKKSLISIITNGWDWDYEKLVYFRDLGVDNIRFSLDSGIAEEHDEFRHKEGSFRKIMDNIGICRKIGLIPTIITCVLKDTTKTEGFKKLVELSKNQQLITSFSPAAPLGAFQGADVMVSDDDLDAMQKLCQEDWLFDRDIFKNLNRQGCPGFKQTIYVSEYGDVQSCPYVHISFGNIREKSLREIRDLALKNPFFKNYHPKCLACDDKAFVDKYLSKNFSAEFYPVKAEDVFINDSK